MDNSADVAGWIRLAHTRGIGLVLARKLLGHFGLPANIFAADRSVLRTLAPASKIDALLAPADPALLARTLAWLAEPGNYLLTLADAGYPQNLLEIPDPPLMLYVKGDCNLLAKPAIAIVGSRNATAQGAANAEKFSAVLGQAGLCIVSGMALGIDTAAHRGSLHAGGATIAVIGTGADLVYPARNRALAHKIAAQGAIVSEYPLGTPGIAANFPRRNRIISGLSRGVLVIEAAAQSGSLITARMAGEQGRDVFAIPGSIHSPLAKGCHQLIRQGAMLVESPFDILDALGIGQRKECNTESAVVADTQESLLHHIGFEPVDTDTLAMRCGLGPAELGAQLLLLEMDGMVELLQGGAYQRLA
jgi:DNA processing protein